jgi:hypothetical protein
VLSPRGVPTPLAATRLLPPDSLMAALPDADFQARVAAGSLKPRYGTPIDRQSAYEILTGRIEAAKQAAAAAAGLPAPAPGMPIGSTPAGAAGAPGVPTAKEIAAEQRAAAKAQSAAERQARADARARDRMIQTGIREVSHVATSRVGQDLLRGVFGTLFGKH